MGDRTAKVAARRAANSELLDRLARLGYLTYGVLHLMVGALGVQIAFGGGGTADESGAMAAAAQTGFGRVLLWVGGVAFAALSLWWVVDAVFGAREPDGSRRLGDTVKGMAKAGVFAFFAVLAVRFAVNAAGSSGSQAQESLTARLMNMPGGRLVVAAIGAVVIAVGLYHAYKGVSRRFLDDLDSGAGAGATGSAVEVLGVIGYPAKGVSLAIIGGLFVVAAAQRDPNDAGGLDEALRSLREQPYGTWLLVVVALGLAVYGLYCFARARFQRG